MSRVVFNDDADVVVVHEDNKMVAAPSRGPLRRGAKGHRKRMQAMRLILPRALLPELKRAFNVAFWDAETLDDPGTGASTYYLLSQIAQGSNPTQRIGDVIYVHRVVIRMYIEQSSSATFSTAELRLVADTEPAAGGPAWTTVFQGIGGSSIQAYHVAIPDFDLRWRYKYLREVSVPMSWTASSVNAGVTTSAIRPVSAVWDIKVDREVAYNSTSAYPVKGQELILWGWSSLNANTPKCWASYEIFFTDA
jgi:hypothetical protein